jgi:hypothetical protein
MKIKTTPIPASVKPHPCFYYPEDEDDEERDDELDLLDLPARVLEFLP